MNEEHQHLRSVALAALVGFKEDLAVTTLNKYGQTVEAVGNDLTPECLRSVPAGQFNTHKWAFVFHLRIGIHVSLSRADKSRDNSERSRHLQSAADAAYAINAIRAMAPPPDARTRKGKSARKGFATLDVNWREILVQHAGKNSRLPMAVMAISGIRPSELELGVELTEAPDDTLAVRVQGTKVSKGKGQKTRTLFFRTDQSSMIRWIVSCVKQAGGLLRVGRKPRQLRKDVAAASKRASYKLLKPYSFRHAVASDLKASDTDKVDLAAVLGHQSTATQKKYGKKSLSKRGTTSLVRVNYSTPIRTPDRPYPASSARITVKTRTLLDDFTP